MRTLATRGRAGAGLALAGAIGVGSVAFTQIKVVLRTLSPWELTAGRVVFSALAFTLVVGLQPRRRSPVRPADRWTVVACGLGGSAGFHLFYSYGQQQVSVAVAAVVTGSMPVVVAALEVLVLRHRLIGRQVAGLVLSVAGVTVMSLDGGGGSGGAPSGSPGWWAGLLAVLAAVVVWSGVTVATRSLGDRYDNWWLNTPGTLLGAVVVVAVVLVVPGQGGGYRALSLSGWFMLVWLGMVGSAFIYAAIARAVRDLHATTVASLSTLITPLGVVVGWLALGERPTPLVAVGGAVVIVGAVLVTAVPASPAVRTAHAGAVPS